MASQSKSIIARISSFIKRKTSLKYTFNLQYENNEWNSLRNLADLGRYSLIVGYVKYFFKNARVADLGCGEGILLERFTLSDYSYYLGVDISEVAIESARKKENSNARFIVGNLDKLKIEGNFDAIIYNESMCYMKDPNNAVLSLFKNLNPGGIFIVSNYNNHGKEPDALWIQLAEILDLHERTRITNMAGDIWTIHVYKIKDK